MQRLLPAEAAALRGIPPQSRCARQLPQGDAFRGGGKLSGIAKSRPLGEGGLTRSGKTEGVLPGKPLSGQTAKLPAMPRALPLGEVDLRSKDGEGEDATRSAVLSQKAALQLPFAVTTPPVKK